MKKRFLSIVLSLCMLLTMFPFTANATESTDSQETKWNISKSKTATELDENYESQITLSLPAAEEQLVSDVVFVLDKSTSAKVEEEALTMLKTLQQQIQDTQAKVKVGVVIFNQKANVTGFMDLATEYEKIEAAIREEISSGTNSHAGLLAGKAMLDADTSVDANRKYLIFVSDGITYMYNESPTAIGLQNGDKTNIFAGPDNWMTKYGSNNAPDNWSIWLNEIGELITKDGSTYDYSYGTEFNGTENNRYIAYDEREDHAMSIDKALYLTYMTYQDIVDEGYHCYAMTADANANHPWATSFMNYLAGDEVVSFESIQNDIYYLLDKGSYVEDYMGYVEDDYNFDFVNDAEKLSLKVGNETYKAEKTAENTYSFANGNYVLTYEKGNGTTEEHFVWEINVPVKITEPVQLTYSVKLTNPKSESGTYGTYDEDGSEGYTGLYTNDKAVLYPVASDGTEGAAEEFPKPTVSYKMVTLTYVSNGGTEYEDENYRVNTNVTLNKVPTREGYIFVGWYADEALTKRITTVTMDTDKTVYAGWEEDTVPDLNKEDHVAYIIGYPDLTVQPEGKITRAEVATIFFRLLTDESRAKYWSQTNDYPDVSEDAWFNNAISTLTNAGILKGDTEGTFRPDEPITRAEFAAIAARFDLTEYDGTSEFTDVPETHWAAKEIAKAEYLGWIKGDGDGKFRPNDPIRRAEVMTLVNRVLKRAVNDDGLLEDMKTWIDNDDSEVWYYYDVQEATNSHNYMRSETAVENQSFYYEKWIEVLTPPDWAALEKTWSEANDY